MCSRDSCTLTKLSCRCCHARPALHSWNPASCRRICGRSLTIDHLHSSRPNSPATSTRLRLIVQLRIDKVDAREGRDKMWTQIDPANAHEATLPPTNQNLSQYHFIPAGTPTAHAVGRRGGVLGVEGTTHCAPHNSRFEHARCKRARYR